MLLKMLKSLVRNTGAPRAAGGADYPWVGNDLADGIEAGDERFAPARVAALWARVLEG